MASQDVDDVVAEVTQLLDDLEHDHVDIEEFQDDLEGMEEMARKDSRSVRIWNDGTRFKTGQITSLQEQIDDSTAQIEAALDMADCQGASRSYKQAKFHNALDWILAMDEDESLDLLRNMSADHKAALLNRELQAATEKLHRAEGSLALKDTELTSLTATNQILEVRLRQKDARISEQDALLETSHSEREVSALEAFIADGFAEICRLEDDLRALSASHGLQTAIRDQQLSELRRDLAQRDADLKQKSADLEQKNTELKQKSTELDHMKDDRVLRDAEFQSLRDDCVRKDADLKQKMAELQRIEDDRAHREAEARRLATESTGKDSELERKNAELQSMENDRARIDADVQRLAAECAQKDTELERRDAELQHMEDDRAHRDAEAQRLAAECTQKDTELERKDAEIQFLSAGRDQKDTELLQANANLIQMTAETRRLEEIIARKDTELTRANANFYVLLTGTSHDIPDIDRWAPLANSSRPLAPATPSTAIDQPYWTVALSRRQSASPPSSTGLLVPIALLYSKAIADEYDDDGCVACTAIIRCLEVVEAAPIHMILELLRCLLANANQDDTNGARFGYFLAIWQVLGLIRLRWPETEGLANLEGQYREKVEQLPPELRTFGDLVAGLGRGDLTAAYDGRGGEIPAILSATPHRYCPEQEVLIIAPTTKYAWALDLRHHTIWPVNKTNGNFELDGDHYRLEGVIAGEDVILPCSEIVDLDFIFDYLVM
ncbi:putative flagellar attachment zone protein 1-like isoform X2 [Rosellinia necatrix]|uniref:Putative flagellar attachment zone protein 1-like isoform X2 n=1 Tax=Rosellinia necatrix TaxID=77044 RepID=A0A1W2TPL2_ROSNE|nr:putative flagellar attachment zone protein 1-like isoform X2 [Rosellinia necatrix]